MHLVRRVTALDAAQAYELWADCYDHEPNNVLLAIDDAIFGTLLRFSSLKDKVVVDVGCGTGRHWKVLLAGQPRQLIGFDVSPAMLDRLREKYPEAIVRVTTDHRLPAMADESCDVLVSTLTFGHLPHHDAALAEWSRVLKPGGEIFVTDFHPTAAARGDVTFRHRGKLIAVRHHVHPLDCIIASACRNGLELLHKEERQIDDSHRPYFEAQNALQVFLRSRGLPTMYGLHFQKRPVALNV